MLPRRVANNLAVSKLFWENGSEKGKEVMFQDCAMKANGGKGPTNYFGHKNSLGRHRRFL
jgi:hypothetical protein